jgi:hypothetical protein
MAELVAFVPGMHEAKLRELLTAYIAKGAARLAQELGVEQDDRAIVDRLVTHLGQFAPTRGTAAAGGRGRGRPGLRLSAPDRPRDR